MEIILFVIGDEILSGKRIDRHCARVIELLRERGLALAGVEFLPDDELRIAAAIRRIHAAGDVLLSCGGIGATPDDRTRQAAALAFDRPIEPHAQALALIEARYGVQARPSRVLMAEFPQGAALIPNPVNQVAGFSVENCYFVPGFPEMAWPMLAWVLDGPLQSMHCAHPPVEYRLRVCGTQYGEGDLLETMQMLLKGFPGIKLSSLPSRGVDGNSPHIELGVRGTRAEAARAYTWLHRQLATLQPPVTIEELDAP